MDYEHTQRAPLHILIDIPALVMAYAAWSVRAQLTPMFVLLAAGVLMAVISFSFRHLTVRDEGQYLAVRFGPLPFFSKTIEYGEIRSVESDRSTLLDGWGIHWVPGRGWTYNLWGFDCVKLQVGKKTIRVGTDDVENLVAFLQQRAGLQ